MFSAGWHPLKAHRKLTFVSHFFLLRWIVDPTQCTKGYKITRHNLTLSQRPSVAAAAPASKCTHLFCNEVVAALMQLQVASEISKQVEFGLLPFVFTNAIKKTCSQGTKRAQKTKQEKLKLCKWLLRTLLLGTGSAGAAAFCALK